MHTENYYVIEHAFYIEATSLSRDKAAGLKQASLFLLVLRRAPAVAALSPGLCGDL